MTRISWICCWFVLEIKWSASYLASHWMSLFICQQKTIFVILWGNVFNVGLIFYLYGWYKIPTLLDEKSTLFWTDTFHLPFSCSQLPLSAGESSKFTRKLFFKLDRNIRIKCITLKLSFLSWELSPTMITKLQI